MVEPIHYSLYFHPTWHCKCIVKQRQVQCSMGLLTLNIVNASTNYGTWLSSWHFFHLIFSKKPRICLCGLCRIIFVPLSFFCYLTIFSHKQRFAASCHDIPLHFLPPHTPAPLKSSKESRDSTLSQLSWGVGAVLLWTYVYNLIINTLLCPDRDWLIIILCQDEFPCP